MQEFFSEKNIFPGKNFPVAENITPFFLFGT